MNEDLKLHAINLASHLYHEGRISDEERDELKVLIFEEDSILYFLLSHERSEEELELEIIKYCKETLGLWESPDVSPSSKQELH